MSKLYPIGSRWIALVGMVALLVTGFSTLASADTEVNASVVVIVSDDIMKRTTDVERPDEGNSDPDCDNSNSGQGCGNGTTEPGCGSPNSGPSGDGA